MIIDVPVTRAHIQLVRFKAQSRNYTARFRNGHVNHKSLSQLIGTTYVYCKTVKYLEASDESIRSLKIHTYMPQMSATLG